MSDISDVTLQPSDTLTASPNIRTVRNSTWFAMVSLEPITMPLKNWRGSVTATSMATAAARAVRAAKKANPNCYAKSITIVIEKT
jgi:hypothetical protein